MAGWMVKFNSLQFITALREDCRVSVWNACAIHLESYQPSLLRCFFRFGLVMRFSNRTVFVLLALASLGLLAGGLVLGEVARLQPCHLCNFQRLIYMSLAFIAICGALIPIRTRFWAGLFSLTALGGVVTAVQQSWMQYAPQEATECGFGDPTLVERVVDWLGAQWPSMFMVTGFCTNKDWVFLGLSLANWSALCFLALLSVAVWQLFLRDRSR